MSEIKYIVNVNNGSRQGLLSDFLTNQPISASLMVQNDTALALSIRPVRETTAGPLPWADDHLAGDAYIAYIGSPDKLPASGTFTLTIGGQTTAALAFDISAAALTTAISTASVAGGNPALTASLLTTGVYQITGNAFGAVPLISGSAANLFPVCAVNVSQPVAGDVSTVGVQVISLKQENVAIAYPSGAFPSVGISAANVQAASATTNLISKITFSAAGTYAGTYTATILAGGISFDVGGLSPLLSAAQLGAAISLHPAIYYAETDGNADNVAVTENETGYLVEFVGSLSGASLTKTIASNTTASPTVITTIAPHGIANGASIVIAANNGSKTSLVGTWTATVLSTTTLSIPVDCLGSRSITSNTAATPTVITTTSAHGFTSGDVVTISANNGSDATIAGTHVATVLSGTTFSIPVDCTVAGGVGGTVIDTAFTGGTGGALSATAPTLAVANVSLVAPVGVLGAISLNTINLAQQFYATDADSLDFFFSVKRTRASGEVKTILRIPITLSRDIIDAATMTVLPAFIGANYRIKANGTFQWGPSAGDGLYTTPTLYGTSGAYYLDFGAGES